MALPGQGHSAYATCRSALGLWQVFGDIGQVVEGTVPGTAIIRRVLVIAAQGIERSRLRQDLDAAGYDAEEAELGFDGIATVMSLLPDVVIMRPPDGVLGSAYLAQFRFADYAGPLLVIGHERLRASVKGAPGPVFFSPTPAEVLGALQVLPEALRATSWHAA